MGHNQSTVSHDHTITINGDNATYHEGNGDTDAPKPNKPKPNGKNVDAVDGPLKSGNLCLLGAAPDERPTLKLPLHHAVRDLVHKDITEEEFSRMSKEEIGNAKEKMAKILANAKHLHVNEDEDGNFSIKF